MFDRIDFGWGVLNLVRFKIKKILFTSSSEVYGNSKAKVLVYIYSSEEAFKKTEPKEKKSKEKKEQPKQEAK